MTTITRRNFLKLGMMATGAAATAGCSAAGRSMVQAELPASLAIPQSPISPSPSPILRFLNRAGFGPRPGDVARVEQMGLAAYLDEQLSPETIDDTAADLMIRGLDEYHLSIDDLINRDQIKDAARTLIYAATVRALSSQRQLNEAVVEFWSDHFNIYLRKNQMMPLFKMIDDRDTIRPHALSNFRDLLHASAQSQAMLIYLDNVRNTAGEPNENYAREIMELHSLGVHAGYTQTDIQEAARALTGWSVARRGRKRGQTQLRMDQHDNGQKTILGTVFPANQGENDVPQLVNLLADQPATAQFMATKLVRRFVADEPPAALVAQISQTFTATDGDIKAMLRQIFLSSEFGSSPAKLKRPFTFMASALRALHADLGLGRQLWVHLRGMGQPLFLWPAPNGYPDVSSPWAANLLPRWNFALALAHNQIRGVKVDLERLHEAGIAGNNIENSLQFFAGIILNRELDNETMSLFTNYINSKSFNNEQTKVKFKDTVAMMLASPAFQWT